MITINQDRFKNSKLYGFELPDGVWVAGGAVRDSLIGEKWSDIDVFGCDKESIDKYASYVSSNGGKLVYDALSLKTYMWHGEKIQFIYDYYSSTIDELFAKFDFTVCQFAIMKDASSEKYSNIAVCANPECLIDLFRKRLVLTEKFSSPISTLKRLQKYIQKGYTICDGGIIAIANKISGMAPQQIQSSMEFYPDGTPRIIMVD